jgi:hypothetical protein
LYFQQGNVCGSQVLVKYLAKINPDLTADIRFNLFRGNSLMPKISVEPVHDGEPLRVVIDDVANGVQHVPALRIHVA